MPRGKVDELDDDYFDDLFASDGAESNGFEDLSQQFKSGRNDKNETGPPNLPNVAALSPKERIDAQLQSLDGVSKLFGRRELKILHEVIWDNETVLRIVQGFYNNGQGILVATDRRLIFINRGMIWGIRVEDFPYDKISSIQYETGILFGKITIFTSGNRAEISHIQKALTRPFAEGVRAYIAANGGSRGSSAQIGSCLGELERLAKLREAGHLSEQEYESQKKRVLEGR